MIKYTEMQKKILLGVITKFGQAHQAYKLIEEMSELSKAICKLAQANKYNPTDEDLTCLQENVISEMIDVEIVLWQLTNEILKNKETSSFYKAEKLRKFKKIKQILDE